MATRGAGASIVGGDWEYVQRASTPAFQTSAASLPTLQCPRSSRQTVMSTFERLKSVPVTASESLAATLQLDNDLVELFGHWNVTRLAAMREVQSSPHTEVGCQEPWHWGKRITRDPRLNGGGHERFDNVNSPRVSVTVDTRRFWRMYAQSKMKMDPSR